MDKVSQTIAQNHQKRILIKTIVFSALVQTNLTNHEEGKSYAYASGKKETIAQGTTPQETFLGKCNAVPRG